MVPLGFERDSLIDALTEQGISSPGSWLVFTYVRRDFIDGRNLYNAAVLYRRFRQRRKIWKFGLNPHEVDAFVAEYGWRLAGQAGPNYYVQQYIGPSGRDLPSSELEWSAYAEKL